MLRHESWELHSRQCGCFAGNGRIRLRSGGKAAPSVTGLVHFNGQRLNGSRLGSGVYFKFGVAEWIDSIKESPNDTAKSNAAQSSIVEVETGRAGVQVPSLPHDSSSQANETR